jgi:hypothetical protein
MTYNGWKNYETWNVALWIGNDEGLYISAKDCGCYAMFQARMLECSGQDVALKTPDGVAWNDSGLDTEALDEMIEEL